MARLKTEAIVLKRTDLGESDRLITLLSKDYGKFKAIAKGARRSKRRFSGCLELFSQVRVQYVDRGRSLHRLEEAVLVDSHEPLKTDLIAIAHAGYVTELAAAFLGESDEAAATYQFLVETLSVLDQGPMQTTDLRRYELSVLRLAGFAPQFDACLDCDASQSPDWHFDIDQSGVLCNDCISSAYLVKITAPVRRFLSDLQSGQTSLSKIDPACQSQARDLLAKIIDRHLGKPLKSREFLRQLAQKK
ncbi:MAG: DNA repair protein RecO [Deltaproteobacteria bacterium]|nr:DNA repair protein RecO [Deltaproteobacteria bacterium]